MSTPRSVEEDLSVPLLQENGERARGELRSRREKLERRVRLEAEGLEEGLGRRVDGTEGLQNKGHKPALVLGSQLVITTVLNTSTVVSSLARSTVEVGVGSRMDDGDVHEGEVVGKVELEIWSGTRETQIGRLQEAGNAKLVGSSREERRHSVVAGGDRERSEELAGEEVSRVSSKPDSTRAERRQVVVRGKTETQARGKSKGVVREGVGELGGSGLQPKGRAIVGQRTKARVLRASDWRRSASRVAVWMRVEGKACK